MVAVEQALIVEDGALTARQGADAPDQGPDGGVAWNLGRPDAEGVRRVGVGTRSQLVGEIKRPEPLRHAEPRGARTTAPGGDDDDAVRSLRAVAGRRR